MKKKKTQAELIRSMPDKNVDEVLQSLQSAGFKKASKQHIYAIRAKASGKARNVRVRNGHAKATTDTLMQGLSELIDQLAERKARAAIDEVIRQLNGR